MCLPLDWLGFLDQCKRMRSPDQCAFTSCNLLKIGVGASEPVRGEGMSFKDAVLLDATEGWTRVGFVYVVMGVVKPGSHLHKPHCTATP